MIGNAQYLYSKKMTHILLMGTLNACIRCVLGVYYLCVLAVLTRRDNYAPFVLYVTDVYL